MKLIIEEVNDVEYLAEEKDGKKSYFIEGNFMVAATKNRNGRLYPRSVLETAVNEYLPMVKDKRALGELGHPNGPNINMDRVSHLITDLKFNENTVVGRAKILNTPMGRIVQTFLDEGIKPGVSSRGLGSLKPAKDGLMEVQSDFRLATIDIVNDPSGPGCFVNGILENTEWILENGTWVQKEAVEAIKKEIKKLSRRELEEQKERLFKRFLKVL